jgi:hypothetical protein
MPLLDSTSQAGSAEFLLIAAGENEMEVKFNQLFAETIGDQAQLWVALGAPHTGAFGLYPDVYEGRVIALINKLLQ